MKIAVVGSRQYQSIERVKEELDSVKESGISIITGGAPGVDQAAVQWTKDNGIPCEVIRPVTPEDKFSYLLRNVEIIAKADLILAFWDGKSNGTRFVINYAKQRFKLITVYGENK